MRNNNIICSKSFWENFRKDYEILNRALTPEEITKLQCHLYYRLMFHESSVHFEFDEAYMESSQDEFLLQLWHNVASGHRPKESLQFSCNFKDLHKGIKEDCSSTLLNSLFLSEDVMASLSKHGIMVLSEADYLNNLSIFKDSGRALKKNNKSSWNELLYSAKHLFNAMIIVDNYLFAGKANVNVTSILDSLLPDQTDIPFHLTIISSTKVIQSDGDLARKRESVLTSIKQIRPNLAKHIVLEIYAVSTSEIHDRTILTNYMWIGSGAGFDIFNIRNNGSAEAAKSTKLSAVYPRFIQGIEWEEAYKNLIEDIRKTLRIYGKSSINRLLQQY